ncbi:MAG: heavy metal translocating P-type ATPase, partial [Synergistaceae bacterium]|nr:heavy metal translocating P-type ATPase [Synergistaceae bacterium]
IIPSMINPSEFTTWLYRALTFLVISCPCALVISVPLAFFSAVGGAGRAGILVKGSNFIETLAKASCVLFDKTGTLTRGVFEVVAVHPEIITENELLHLAAHVERYSTHPAGEALRRAYPDENDECIIESSEEIAGYGVRAKVNGAVVCAGSSKFMDMLNVKWHPCTKASGTIIHVAVNNTYAGHVVISDIVKPDAKPAVDALKSQGINRIIMLTGDRKESAEEAAALTGIHEVYSSLLPADKVNKVDEVIREGYCTVFAGDGINDAPVIARADAGIAMGALGSDAAIESADIVLIDDDPRKISQAIRISRKAMKIAKENIIFSVGVKVLCLALSAMGYADMWLAVFADVGVMILAVMNSIRPMFANKKDRAV